MNTEVYVTPAINPSRASWVNDLVLEWRRRVDVRQSLSPSWAPLCSAYTVQSYMAALPTVSSSYLSHFLETMSYIGKNLSWHLRLQMLLSSLSLYCWETSGENSAPNCFLLLFSSPGKLEELNIIWSIRKAELKNPHVNDRERGMKSMVRNTDLKRPSCAVLTHPVVSDSLQPHGLQPTRLLCLWGFSRQEHWSGLPCPPPGALPNLGIEPRSPTVQADSLLFDPPGKPQEV